MNKNYICPICKYNSNIKDDFLNHNCIWKKTDEQQKILKGYLLSFH